MHVRCRLIAIVSITISFKNCNISLTGLQMSVQVVCSLIGPMAHEASMLLPTATGRRSFSHRRTVPHVCCRSEWTVGIGGWWWPIVYCDRRMQLPEASVARTDSVSYQQLHAFLCASIAAAKAEQPIARVILVRRGGGIGDERDGGGRCPTTPHSARTTPFRVWPRMEMATSR